VPASYSGVVAQSLPDEILAMSNSRADGQGEPMLAVRLADWLGLVTIVLQETDRRMSEMQQTLSAVDRRNLELQEENDRLKTRLASLRDGSSAIAQSAP
jgi:cell division protein FtsB